MGLFDKYLPYNGSSDEESGSEFSMGLSDLDMDTVPSFAPESYATYQPSTSSPRASRASQYQSSLDTMLGKFDSDGRYGLTDEDRSYAKNQKWSELGKRLAKAGFSHSYQGYGNAMQDLGGAMGEAEEISLNKDSTENLRAELQKLDMEDRFSTAEKNRLALKTAQDDFDAKEEARLMGAAIFKEEMPPEKIEMMIANIKNPMDQKIARLNFARVQLYMEAGDHDKAMAAMEEINKLIPETIQDRIDKLFEAKRAEAEGEAKGKLDAQGKAIATAPEGYVVNNGNLDFLDPLDRKVKQAQIDSSYANTKNDAERLRIEEEKVALGTRGQMQDRARRETLISGAAAAKANLRLKNFDIQNGGIVKKVGNKWEPVDPEFQYSQQYKLMEPLFKKAMDADGILLQYPALQFYGPLTNGTIRQMLIDQDNGVAPPEPVRPPTTRVPGRRP